MQDIHWIGGGSGRLFGGGDRRLRPHHHHHHHQNQNQNQNHLQEVKCPRCDSLNTKFCYYNNYNLSQPRYYCKSCRRYWTRGGILRNVPVGGGCRKSKKPSKSRADLPDLHNSSSNSTAAAVEVAPASADLDTTPIDRSPDGGIFPEIGNESFASVMTSSEDSSFLGFNTAPFRVQQLEHGEGEVVLENQIDLEIRESNGGLAALDWNCGGDQCLFDLSTTVDQAYWSQTQWTTENDHSLYLP